MARVWRFQVSTRPELPDPTGEQTKRLLDEFGVQSIQSVRTARLFTIELTDGTAGEREVVQRVAGELLIDPVCETCHVASQGEAVPAPADALVVEVHYKPGIMDNVAQSTLLALADMGIKASRVATGRRYEISPVPPVREQRQLGRLLGNSCIEDIVFGSEAISPLPAPPLYEFRLRHVAIRDLNDPELERLSLTGHMFLSLHEMQTIRACYRGLGRDPTDLELETLAQTWSEHCVHKTLRSAVEYVGAPFPSLGLRPEPTGQESGAPFTVRYGNLLKDTVVRATEELIRQGRGPLCLSVFKDNAGVIALDDQFGIAFKVETHNHPSAIEPYGGAATGLGGVIRDILGCGLGAKPIADTDVFCVAPPDWPIASVPKGVIHPKSILKGIVAGVRDYGNRMGIPTVNGAVHFDPRYLGNPLVHCGCVGLIPRDRVAKAAKAGDLVVLMGGRTGRDGIHGATFSSAELTDRHAQEFAHAVQIGNAIEEKKVLDVILQARDHPDGCLYSAITDCGAGGLSSAVGEMAAEAGAEVELEEVPLKYTGLRYDEIWISEAQERMVLAVPPGRVEKLLALARAEGVEATVIGRFTDHGRLIVRFRGTEVGNLDLQFLHHGMPKVTRQAQWWPDGHDRDKDRPSRGLEAVRRTIPQGKKGSSGSPAEVVEELKRRLSDPTTASKHWVIRQYDHEVQGGSVIKPLAGRHDGPSDAAVIRPRLNSNRGIALGCGLASQLADVDPYWMAIAAIDEALRNVVCVGGDPAKTTILDNFCWPRAEDPRNLGALVRACQACYDAAMAYGLPFISGKDSLNNEFALDAGDGEIVRQVIEQRYGDCSFEDYSRDGRLAIPYTLLISAVSLIDDVSTCVSMDLKQERGRLYLIGRPTRFGSMGGTARPTFDIAVAAATHRLVARLIRQGLALAVHDVSDGGVLVTCAEMCMAAGRSCRVHWPGDRRVPSEAGVRSPPWVGGWNEDEVGFFFEPLPALYVVEVANGRHEEVVQLAGETPVLLLATVGTGQGQEERFTVEPAAKSGAASSVPLAELRQAWRAPLDW
jgi:phosphoribosylformylglycinamidine synthase